MTSSELKRLHETLNPDSHFFSRKTLELVGDKMRNFRVRQLKDRYEVYRKNPVNNGLNDKYYFDKISLKQIFTESEAV